MLIARPHTAGAQVAVYDRTTSLLALQPCVGGGRVRNGEGFFVVLRTKSPLAYG